MRNISDVIEQYLKQVLKESQANAIEIKRQDIAQRFECVPSQINYVINTRFTVEKGYLVESKRGGGGYIRIRRVILHEKQDVLSSLMDIIHEHPRLNEQLVENVLIRLVEEQMMHEQEAQLIYHLLSDEALNLQVDDRSYIRRQQLLALMKVLRYRNGG
ncbi:MAG: CtsR family transcriptional regulator [Exiguobacterium sp.]|uniref:CtsR family transcriptional regulator n=1 Tax=Exiguobacterium TaxID=33986 RepID=UPI00093E4D1E|nr:MULTISPECIES: CtsR family transcriptional regulator [Exiguobacterium]QPI67794.1 CtsR family transcriptional regulator [Exiguobacterium sp. PBE]MBG0916123.1 CtsR family transcriptional regulator [Exiguobacterium sp. SRB7LM]MBQ6458418.1 CtsR family transcriptional regulator [Exiguobacterium sp.]MBR3061147.1 CtsR family transcriptional regulator [Exiguobacterium sp.]MCV9901421.1 CtsR family transcriptional regulator [Exiguobacterium sp. N5]